MRDRYAYTSNDCDGHFKVRSQLLTLFKHQEEGATATPGEEGPVVLSDKVIGRD